MTRYVVVGAGAVGALLAAQLHKVGLSSVLIARGRNLDAIRANGLRVARPSGVDQIAVPVAGSVSEARLTVDDVLVVATKTQDAEAVLSELAWASVLDAHGEPTLLGADLPVLTLQNGLSTEDLALRRFARVYGVTVGIAASHLVPGEVASPSEPVIGLLWIGAYPQGATAEQEQFAADFRTAGYLVTSVDDIAAIKAWKLSGNVGNALDVFDGSAEDKLRAREAVGAELRASYAAAGIVPADPGSWLGGLGSRLTNEPVPGYPELKLSTWQSFARGTSSEVDHLNGEVVLLGRLHGVDTPVNERIQRLLGAQSARGDAPGVHHISEVLDALPVPLPVP